MNNRKFKIEICGENDEIDEFKLVGDAENILAALITALEQVITDCNIDKKDILEIWSKENMENT